MNACKIQKLNHMKDVNKFVTWYMRNIKPVVRVKELVEAIDEFDFNVCVSWLKKGGRLQDREHSLSLRMARESNHLFENITGDDGYRYWRLRDAS